MLSHSCRIGNWDFQRVKVGGVGVKVGGVGVKVGGVPEAKLLEAERQFYAAFEKTNSLKVIVFDYETSHSAKLSYCRPFPTMISYGGEKYYLNFNPLKHFYYDKRTKMSNDDTGQECKNAKT